MSKDEEQGSEKNPTPKSSFMLHWLRLLFWVTLVLLVFQVFLGLASHSLTLLADSPHAVIDVLTYAFNYWIEWLKNHEVDARVTVFGRRVKPWKIDMVGSMTSVMVLVVTMCFVIVEVFGEFEDVDEVDDSELYIFRSSALFIFALVSTISNIVILMILRRRRASEKSTCVNSEPRRQLHIADEMFLSSSTVEHSSSATAQKDLVTSTETQPVANIPPPPLVPLSFPRRERRGKILDQTKPNTEPTEVPDANDYPPPPSPPSESFPRRERRQVVLNQQSHLATSQDPSIDAPETIPTPNVPRGSSEVSEDRYDSSSLPKRGSSSKKLLNLSKSFGMHACGDGCNHGCEDPDMESWSSFLHTLVHPGCTGHGGSCDHSDGLEALAQDSSGLNLQVKRRNLNVDSALLHVVSDVFRGVFIFFLAVMIRLEIVGAKRADAICALLVVGLVLVGAGTIFKKAFSVFGCRCLGGGQLYSKFCEEECDQEAPAPPVHKITSAKSTWQTSG